MEPLISSANFLSEDTKSLLMPKDLEFFDRVWRTDIETYKNRLTAINFFGHSTILDAGCGFGQWSVALSKLNQNVYSFDYHPGRISALKDVLRLNDLRNIYPSVQSVDSINYEDNFFDAIFCYGVIMFADHRKVIREFYRILKPGGKLYMCTNGLGWYIYNLIETHNSSVNFDSRKMAAETIDNTLRFFHSGHKDFEGQICVPSSIMIKELTRFGFDIMAYGSEGSINLSDISIKPFFKGEYLGYEGVYEILALK